MFAIVALMLAAAPGPAACTGRPDSLQACLAKLREPGAARFEASEALGRLGQPALESLAQCARTEADMTVAGMCVRALELTGLAEASVPILEAARRKDLSSDGISYAAIAIGKRRLAEAVPVLEQWLDRAQDSEAASGAIALFQVDPERFRSLTPKRRLAYAAAMGDRAHTWKEVRESEAYRRQIGELMALCAAALKSGELAPIPALLALRNAGGPENAPDVAAFLETAGPADFRNALDVLQKWEAPHGIPAAVRALSAEDRRSVDEAARYLGRFKDDERARKALRDAWAGAKDEDARCTLAFPMARMGLEPDAVELAQLLASRCRHDMTILWDRLVPARVSRLVEYLNSAKKDDPMRAAVQEALEWQCAQRKETACKPAAKHVKGARRPSHPD